MSLCQACACLFSESDTHTHTHNCLTAFVRGNPGRPVPEETPNLIIGYPLSSSSIYNDPRHPLCSFYVLDNPLGQSLSRCSLVFLLVLDPELYTPYISSPNHHHLFAAHAHTNTACCAAKPITNAMSSIPSFSLSSLLGSLSFSLTPHIHLTILISAR